MKTGLKPRFKLWLSSGDAEGAFGDGKWRLLRAIEREGSLRVAAHLLGISYRKAWGDIKKAEESLGMALVEKRHGGRDGGSTRLTSAGKEWLALYTRFRTKVEKSVKKAHEEVFVGA
jgi:molybdate transport system regulatory protein